MPKPNRMRSIHAERALAQRVAFERDKRGWTYDSLARRMTDKGCPINGSAIYKIEKADPPRRIVVDELVAFSAVFGVSLEEMLVPAMTAESARVYRAVAEYDDSALSYAAYLGILERHEDELLRVVASAPDAAVEAGLRAYIEEEATRLGEDSEFDPDASLRQWIAFIADPTNGRRYGAPRSHEMRERRSAGHASGADSE